MGCHQPDGALQPLNPKTDTSVLRWVGDSSHEVLLQGLCLTGRPPAASGHRLSLIRSGAPEGQRSFLPTHTRAPQNIRVPGTCFPSELGDGWVPGGPFPPPEMYQKGCLVMEKLHRSPALPLLPPPMATSAFGWWAHVGPRSCLAAPGCPAPGGFTCPSTSQPPAAACLPK